MDRVILHCDANSFYASCEVARRPELCGLPVSVGGDPEARHGIILASTQQAKSCGVQTGMALWQAYQLCPQLIILPPDFGLYTHMSSKLRAIYMDYSPYVESYGLDECWIDYTSQEITLADGKTLADILRRRVRDELDICLSVGVSFNKVFAKLASDYKKPDATTVVTPDNYRSIVWPLPISDLLNIGPKTVPKLHSHGIHTIGELACTDPALLHSLFGKTGIIQGRVFHGRCHQEVQQLKQLLPA